MQSAIVGLKLVDAKKVSWGMIVLLIYVTQQDVENMDIVLPGT
jgi:hypothetical protein